MRTPGHIKNIVLSVVTLVTLILIACQAPSELRTTPSPILTLSPIPSAQVVATPTPTPLAQTSAPSSGAALLHPASSKLPTPPEADLYSIAQRLKLEGKAPLHVVNPQLISVPQGTRRTFWLTDLDKNLPFQVSATLRYVTPHAYMWLQDDLPISQEAIEASAKRFESEIYPTVTSVFGTEWQPGVDNDPHLYIIHARIPQVAGYYSSRDEYPKAISQYSNEVEVIYINVDALALNTTRYFAVLAHELQHAVHWHVDSSEEAWVNEGLSELSTQVTKFPVELVRTFYNQPNTQLNDWPDDPRKTAPHYGASFLFMDYLTQHYGGYQKIKDLVLEPADGIQGIENWLAKGAYKDSFEEVFGKWVVANLMGDPQGPYGYNNRGAIIRDIRRLTEPGSQSGSVNQFAARYYELSLKEDVIIKFQGTPQVKIIPNDSASGTYEWWSNRGDEIDSTLEREFDLSKVTKATLKFKTWYEIEKDWDYTYAEVSQDNGKTWQLLESSRTSSANPVGNSFGPGYTGNSGGGSSPAWIDESLDLTPYTGKKVLVRFEYVTDGAVNNSGFAIDDISLPEIGYFSDFEKDDGGWSAQGFVRMTNVLPQTYLVQVVETIGNSTKVERLPLNEKQQGTIVVQGLGALIKKAYLVVSATTQDTTQPAPYTFSIDMKVPAGFSP